jgi:16S rRNA (cytosine1402-N4)-methyltransferase
LASVVEESGVLPLSGVLFDLGVSSPQLDRAGRGFSYRADGPLDMRMDPESGVTAADLVNGLPADALARLFRENGEGRLSGRIARAVVAARPLTSTGQLAEVVAGAVPPAARRKGHPARRVFQALRIEVNDEQNELRAALPAALSNLAVGGVLAVISYHSGEDRLVKQTFAEAATGGCVCPPNLPCVCGAVPRHRVVFRGARKASASEVAANPRAEAARLRAIVRTDED